MSSPLFSSYTLGRITLKNRVVMAPLTRSRAIENVPNSLIAEYYSQRAGIGLIITEGTSPSPNGLGYPRIPGAYNGKQIEGWRKVVEGVHAKGSHIFLQLMHTGRVSHPDNLPSEAKVLAPSAVALESTKMYVDGKGELEIPVATAMSIEDIKAAIAEYVTSAKNAIDAGFDGVELHAANGYLLEQFLHPGINERADEYGGSVENRLRIIKEVAEQTAAAIGSDRVGIRISPYGVMNETGAFDGVDETHVALAKIAKEVGLAYMHLTDHEAMGTPPVPEEIKAKIRSTFGGTLILCGGFSKESAIKAIEENKGDLIAFGRPSIANPDLVNRLENDYELADPDQSTFYTPGKEGYTDYPTYSGK